MSFNYLSKRNIPFDFKMPDQNVQKNAPLSLNYLVILSVYLTVKNMATREYNPVITSILNFINKELGYKMITYRTVLRQKMKIEDKLRECQLIEKDLKEIDLLGIIEKIAKEVGVELSDNNVGVLEDIQDDIESTIITVNTLIDLNGVKEEYPEDFIHYFKNLNEMELSVAKLDIKYLIAMLISQIQSENQFISDLKSKILRQFLEKNCNISNSVFMDEKNILANKYLGRLLEKLMGIFPKNKRPKEELEDAIIKFIKLYSTDKLFIEYFNTKAKSISG